MAEWLKAPHSKCGIGVTLSGVQIPLSPPNINKLTPSTHCYRNRKYLNENELNYFKKNICLPMHKEPLLFRHPKSHHNCFAGNEAEMLGLMPYIHLLFLQLKYHTHIA